MQNQMKSNFLNYVQKVFDQVKQSAEAYQMNFKGDILSLGTALTPNLRSRCVRITERLERGHPSVSDSGEGPS